MMTEDIQQLPEDQVVDEGQAANGSIRMCQALTRSGQPCHNRALPGSDYCRVHQPAVEAAENLQSEPAEGATGEAVPETGVAEAEPAATADQLDEATLREMQARLDKLAAELEARMPGYRVPPFSPQALISLLEQNIGLFQPQVALGLVEQLRQAVGSNLLDVEMWKGLWTLLNYTIQYEADVAKRRVTGQYEVDPYGFDQEFFDTIRPVFDLLYKVWWRVTTIGVENVPATGRVLLVANHSGVLPLDGAMIITSILNEHPSQRLVRSLYLDWFPSLPFVSVLLQKTGQVLANPENAERLLNEDQAVLVFPEGVKGVGKLFKDRYHLGRFGRAGFVRIALHTQSPIVPVVVVGAEEIYPTVAQWNWLGRPFGMPFFPITPLFPWLGPLGVVPLPTKWTIQFGEPMHVEEQYGPEAADNLATVMRLSDQVRDRMQGMLVDLLKQRKSVFLG